MARKKKPEEHENHERWLISYADFITLLFAFFVVMYSVSSINEGKYRVLSDTLVSAFDRTRDGLPIKLSSPLRPPIIERDIISPRRNDLDTEIEFAKSDSSIKASEKDKESLKNISEEVAKSLQPLIDKDQIKVKNNDLWVEIEIKSNILFGSGSAILSASAKPVLRKIAGVIKGYDNQIQVEGFTDNIPIDTDEFPSNWELSAARAASVVHLFSQDKVKPHRLSALAYGQYKPIATNVTPEGRAKNRRINIVILSDAIARTTDRGEQQPKASVSKKQEEKKEPIRHIKNDLSPINTSPPQRIKNDIGPINILPPPPQ